MHVLIVGAGAMGCFVASRLVEVDGLDVTLVGRQRFADAFNTHGGLRVTEAGSVSVVERVRAEANIVDGADVAILTVKSYDTAQAVADLKAVYGSGLPVLSLQNGVGNEQTIVDAGISHVLAGSLTTPVSVLAPANIRIDKASSSVGLAAWNEAGAAQIEPVFDVFNRSRFEASRYDSADSLKWSKLLMNMVGNATSAILNQAPGEVFADNRLVDVEIEAWREALRVMASAGVAATKVGSYPFNLFGPAIRLLPKMAIRPIMRNQVVGGRGEKMPSLHIDVYGGRGRSEVAWLNGAVVRRGAEVGVATPVNAALAKTVEEMAQTPTDWDADALLRAVNS